jgi:hypothetical protein
VTSPFIRRFPHAATIVAIVAIVGCATGIEVKVGFNEHADFAKYHTWGWKLDGSIKDPVWARRFQSVLSEELAVHGLKEVPAEQAELWAIVHARLDVKTQVASYAPDWGYGWGPYGSAWAYDSTVEYQVPVGTIILDLVDTKQKQIVWRGRAAGTIQADKTNEEREQRLVSIIKQWFAVFPPIPKSADSSTYKPH